MLKRDATRFLTSVQFVSLLSGERSRNSGSDGKGGHKGNVSSLEAELAELRERYSLMSLKYAEVEAEREELVLKLKNVHTRSWF